MNKASSFKEMSSSLDPSGPVANAIAELYWVMIAIFGASFALVVFLFLAAIFFKKKEGGAPLGDHRFIILGGVIFPTLVVIYFLIYTLLTTQKVFSIPENAFTVHVTGHMWWWEIEYPDHEIEIANEIYIPVGEPVRFVLNAEEVIHSLWVPALAGKMDLLPGIENVTWFQADKPGVYRGQCAEYCGLQHARMSIFVIALEKAEFEKWLEERKTSQTQFAEEHLKLGQRVFKEEGCAECHHIRGTEAVGEIGPDLTHIGSRLYLGAGTIKNSKGNLGGWVAHPQALKPGNKMPAAYIEPQRFDAMISYLESLK